MSLFTDLGILSKVIRSGALAHAGSRIQISDHRGSNSVSVEGALAHSLSSLDQKSPVDESIH